MQATHVATHMQASSTPYTAHNRDSILDLAPEVHRGEERSLDGQTNGKELQVERENIEHAEVRQGAYRNPN